MEKVVVSCSGAKHIGKLIARRLKTEYTKLQVKKFPDNELSIRFLKNIKNKEIILLQSFYGNLNEKIVETLFAFYTAKDLGAKKIKLFALYFPYFRQDKRFHSGECVSIKAMAKLFNCFNKIYFVDPHLHRIKNIKKIFPNSKKLSSIEIISKYVKKLKLKNLIFVGPDSESFQWAKHAAELIKEEAVIFEKSRYSSKRVKIKTKNKSSIKNKNVIIIDDIISTGNTMLETIKEIKKFKPKKIYCICVHGIFVGETIKKLKKHATVLSTNTIPSKFSKININDLALKIK